MNGSFGNEGGQLDEVTRAGLDADGLPAVPGHLPGPRSTIELERLRKVVYPGTSEHLVPFVIESKSEYLVNDIDGNTFVDLVSSSASVPLGAARADLIEPLTAAMERIGNEDSHGAASGFMLPLAEKLIEITPASLTRVDLGLNGTEVVETAVASGSSPQASIASRASARTSAGGSPWRYSRYSGTAASQCPA